jgi:hypothetical protein
MVKGLKIWGLRVMVGGTGILGVKMSGVKVITPVVMGRGTELSGVGTGMDTGMDPFFCKPLR